jgi:hypothetical protein
MEWDGGTIWRIALGVFFVLCGCGLAYALFCLGSVLKRVTHIRGLSRASAAYSRRDDSRRSEL